MTTLDLGNYICGTRSFNDIITNFDLSNQARETFRSSIKFRQKNPKEKKREVGSRKSLQSWENPAIPLREAEQPVNRIVPFPLSIIPGITYHSHFMSKTNPTGKNESSSWIHFELACL